MSAYFLMSVAGGLWLPTAMFPAWMAGISEALPTYRTAEVAWRVPLGVFDELNMDEVAPLLMLPIGLALRTAA